MKSLHESLLLEILSRLDDPADVARCRVAFKAFNTVFPGLRSINLRCSQKWHGNSRFWVSSSSSSSFKEVFLDLISKMNIVESVSIGNENSGHAYSHAVDYDIDDFYFMDCEFVKQWLPRISGSLKSLSIFDHYSLPSTDEHSFNYYDVKPRQSNVLHLISKYCLNLVNLKLKFAWLSLDNLNPMPMLTSLTLGSIKLEDQDLNRLTKCFPNLKILNFGLVSGLEDPKIHLLNLQTCRWFVSGPSQTNLTLITPNLITLDISSVSHVAINVEAPMLCHFDLFLSEAGTFTAKKFENLKTLTLKSHSVGSLLSEFPITKTLENLTLDSGLKVWGLKLSLAKVFVVFPNVSSLRINSHAWLEFEACLELEGWEILDGGKGLKTFCAYLMLVDPSLTFSCVGCVLDQCAGLSNVSLLIHGDVVGSVSKSFKSRCMARWPGLKWRWGIWSTKDGAYVTRYN